MKASVIEHRQFRGSIGSVSLTGTPAGVNRILHRATTLEDHHERHPMPDDQTSTHTALFDLTGKTALVTGGTRGIGMMMARGLLQAGARVVISSRKAQACTEAQHQLTEFGDVRAIPADLSSHGECQRLAGVVTEDSESLHVLINNAGATWGEPLETFPDSAWDKVIDLNLKSPFWLVQALLPALRRAGTADDPARVINVGSIDAIHVSRLPVYSYASSKAALHQLTRVLARELGPQHITVNAVAPGPFPSKMMAATLDAFGDAIAAAAPLRRIGRDDDMAGIAVFLASRAGSYLTGTVIPVDGGIATTASGT
jgi:NAD(P)-dependent dehydrogenase (short-subunit alcohol dehydrogenase family)